MKFFYLFARFIRSGRQEGRETSLRLLGSKILSSQIKLCRLGSKSENQNNKSTKKPN